MASILIASIATFRLPSAVTQLQQITFPGKKQFRRLASLGRRFPVLVVVCSLTLNRLPVLSLPSPSVRPSIGSVVPCEILFHFVGKWVTNALSSRFGRFLQGDPLLARAKSETENKRVLTRSSLFASLLDCKLGVSAR